MQYTIEAKNGGTYDVIVAGGGTAGVIAAIAAARRGARTLILERSFVLGGMLTAGEAGITKFSEHCRDAEVYRREVLDVLSRDPRSVQVAGGIAHEYVERLLASGKALGTGGDAGSYVFTDRWQAEWTLLEMVRESGAEVLYDTRVCLVKKEGSAVTGVVALNKDGFTEFSAKCVIDATGDADVAQLADCETRLGACEADIAEGCGSQVGEMAVFGVMFRVAGVDFARLYDYLEQNPERFWQHEFGVMSLPYARSAHEAGEMSVMRVVIDLPEGKTGLMQVYNLPEEGGAILLGSYCDYAGNGVDARSLSLGQESLRFGARRLLETVRCVPGFEAARITYIPDVGVRETRHVLGRYVLTGMDVLTGRDFPDSIAAGGHPVDIHPIPPEVEHMPMNHWRFHIPYRILLPKGVDNLLVAGRAVSATRMASGSTRTTVQCMAMGEAAGTAAALAVRQGCPVGDVNTDELREELKKTGAIL